MRFSRVAVVGVILSAALFSQEFRSTITGAVTDPTGAPVSGVKITATETRTGVKTPTVTDSSGKYTLPFLSPGNYEISAQAQGFKGARRTGLALGADERPVIDFALEVGDVATSVSVSGDVPLLNSDNASIGQAITTKQLEDIPLNGRTPLMLAQLAIGVTPTAAPTLVHPFDLGGPAAFSVAGTPSQSSELLLDVSECVRFTSGPEARASSPGIRRQ